MTFSSSLLSQNLELAALSKENFNITHLFLPIFPASISFYGIT
jgi:hypothetical protein